MIHEAYVAGLFDGEGSVGRYVYTHSKNGKPYYRLHARITSSNRELLEAVRSEFGGKIYPKDDVLRGRRVMCYDLHFVYRHAERFLKRILPYLILKKEKVIQVVEEHYPGSLMNMNDGGVK